ncbi:MAG: efflux RND transporter permease subunit, partial [Planctomycetota bacterium]
MIDQGDFIQRSIANVINSVMLGGLLAVLVLLFFLRSLRTTLVIALAIPLSIMATLAIVYAAGLTLNLMTLGGLALGVGMMVDSSIVVLENIFRHRGEARRNATQAAISGTGEVAAAIIAGTITTLVIFLPLLVVEGVAGQLFRELALVVVFALSASLVVSLSLVPMLAARLLRRRESDSSGRWQRILAQADRAQSALDQTYHDVLRGILRHRLLTIAGCGLIL